ncbi:hypothetical protein ACPC54_35740 [Kitasatospora sp. NPDC094028]
MEMKGSGFTPWFAVGVNGCAEIRATMTDATDTSDDKREGGFGQKPQDHPAQCTTPNDPYRSH